MIALTGGAGAMGLRLAARLLGRGEEVAILDLERDGSRSRSESIGARFRPCDATRPETLEPALHGARAVVHLAALLLAGEDAVRLDAVNREGTRNVLAAARKVGTRRVVHVSSISVLYRRQNAYSRSKREAEELVRSSGADWTILRPSLAFGDPGAAEFSRFETLAGRLPVLPLPDGGKALKAPVHVDDLADAFAMVLDDPATIGRTFDLHGSRQVSLATMAREIRRSRGASGIVLPIPTHLAAFWARRLAPRLRRAGMPPLLDWQTLTGLLEDAVPGPDRTSALPSWHPRPWSAPPC